jgi:hypothetical protein
MRLKKYIPTLILAVAGLFYTSSVYSQPPPPPPPPPCWPPPCNVPINGGLWILLVLGVAMGAYFIYKRNLKKVF